MARPKTHKERALIISRVIELVNQYGHVNTKNVVELFGLNRATAGKYLRIAQERGGFIRHGYSGIFRDERAVIDYDLQRYSGSRGAGSSLELQPLGTSPVMGRTLQIYGATA